MRKAFAPPSAKEISPTKRFPGHEIVEKRFSAIYTSGGMEDSFEIIGKEVA
jgi:hypothetical protein